MPEEPHQNTGGITLLTVVQQTGLPSTLKGHAQRLIIRWLAGTIAHPYFATVRENLDTIEGRSKVNMMLAEEVGRQAIADPEQIERAKARFLGDTFRKQENVEAVAAAAAAKIEEQSGSDSESKPADEPSADFMNAFTHEAENASSDQLRDRLAGILAGEIKRPGTFSRSVIRLAGEIDQESLIRFQSILQRRVGTSIITPPSWNMGEMFVTGMHLSDLGLVSGVSGTSHNFNPDPSNKGFLIGAKFGLFITAKAATPVIQAPIWLLTKVGLSFADLMGATDERVPLRQFAVEVDKANIRQIIIGKITPSGNGRVNVAHDEVAYIDPSSISPTPPGLVSIPLTALPSSFAKP